MNTVGFPISSKENEFRRALIPDDIVNIEKPELLYIEKGYGEVLGFSDHDYNSKGVNIASRHQVLSKRIICDPKIGDAEYLDSLNNQTIFGWVHAVQNKSITDKIINRNLTAFAWEDMYNLGRHTFYRNNEIAGEAAVFHAFQLFGEMPYNLKVAVLGNGNTARGAINILSKLGADITVYDRRKEKLFRKEMYEFDVIVNAVLWDTTRKDHLVFNEDLKRMKKNSLIIDISCDEKGAIESSIPTTIEDPTYKYCNVEHYVVDHTPSLFYKTSTSSISSKVSKYLNELISGQYSKTLDDALIIKEGKILDSRINNFQNR
ncbi:N(5)-(carboxyethyl)ornithine synthase [Aerococcus urinaeequi]|uniref:N(5)-(Carboxyethyl)ornithine synthase n=1 Tax=Aerococcus urinaeequi TaxID=51665 RepID=A0A7M1KR37_9LACT|nr:N(5)-(carboxyethyl)ornithine synthase [Aerococcus urinaeequi]QOQ78642.1 N(5)-(carboxyethyl)ornithine synthase [Aerococcus urinaeequi]